MSDVSSTRLYLGNLPRTVTKQDIEDHFNSQGTGKITEVKLMNGFGFIEYEDALDARDIVPIFHGSDFQGERLTVQFARGPRHKDNFNGPSDRNAPPRPRRTIYRMQITGLPTDTSWQDLKDFARQSGLDVVYSETGRERDGKGFVEFESAKDLTTAVEKLESHKFKESTVHCTADIQEERPGRDSGYRSRTPTRRYGPPGVDDRYERRGPPPRGYSPGGYPRERSPRGGRYDEYSREYRREPLPPRGRLDEYGHGPPPPRRPPYDDPYERRGPPPPAGYADPYARGDPYARTRSPPRYGAGYSGYEDGRYPGRYW